MSFFPLYINLKDKKILLIGGGNVALEKLEKLIDFTLNIKVISKKFSKDFVQFATRHAIPMVQKAYRKGDINGYDIVVVATDFQELHKEIYLESRDSRVFVNSVDNTAYCDFIFPSYIKRGDLVISVSTSGASPAMANRIRKYIDTYSTLSVRVD